MPVPGIFLFKEADTGRHLVIDGQQRLKSLLYFYMGLFNGREFVLSGIESQWLGKSYKTLADEDRARLDDAVVHAIVFKQDLPEGEINSVYEVFERINTGGVKLSAQEIRSCICHGPFNEFLHELNDFPDWRAIYGAKSKRLKDIEVILRFLAFFERADSYQSPMKHFLNDFMKDKRHLDQSQLTHLKQVFEQTFSFSKAAFGDKAFRPDRSLNTAVLDAVAVALAKRMRDGAPLSPEQANEAYKGLLENERFKEGYVRATADAENVKKRMEEANAAFGAA